MFKIYFIINENKILLLSFLIYIMTNKKDIENYTLIFYT